MLAVLKICCDARFSGCEIVYFFMRCLRRLVFVASGDIRLRKRVSSSVMIEASKASLMDESTSDCCYKFGRPSRPTLELYAIFTGI